MHREEDVTDPPPRRVAVGVALLRQANGDVLLVEKARRNGRARFGLAGGAARAGESVNVACQRVVREETGLVIVPSRVLVIHHTPVAENYTVVFDGGVVPDNGQPPVLVGAAPEELRQLVAPAVQWCVDVALDALRGGPVRVLVGQPDFSCGFGELAR
ncbi:NUDIX domain-containing protein [Streptomyces litchfieldiae]|uniref:NUDIX domain-containing protein n=1 Tax=Streptomyces litchfieldiae TaxID=3075543 RepID=A0ABU2MMF7_9ACTN|nr:NUDIX domain-containing protein [Streptomyces sp. DSM 44938]MDT0342784.1 NUDIX domain-containing protein [Streptomyces sp. DSM 44938]